MRITTQHRSPRLGRFRALPRPEGDLAIPHGTVFVQELDLDFPDPATMELGFVMLDGKLAQSIDPALITRVPIGTGKASVWVAQYQTGEIRVTVDHIRELSTGHNLLHALVNTRRLPGGPRPPRIDELQAIRDLFFPADIDVMHMFPRQEKYINVAEWAYHLWQYPGVWNNEHL